MNEKPTNTENEEIFYLNSNLAARSKSNECNENCFGHDAVYSLFSLIFLCYFESNSLVLKINQKIYLYIKFLTNDNYKTSP